MNQRNWFERTLINHRQYNNNNTIWRNNNIIINVTNGLKKIYKNECSLQHIKSISKPLTMSNKTRRSFAIRAISSRSHVIKIISICIDLIKWGFNLIVRMNREIVDRETLLSLDKSTFNCVFRYATHPKASYSTTFSIYYKVHERSSDMTLEFSNIGRREQQKIIKNPINGLLVGCNNHFISILTCSKLIYLLLWSLCGRKMCTLSIFNICDVFAKKNQPITMEMWLKCLEMLSFRHITMEMGC